MKIKPIKIGDALSPPKVKTRAISLPKVKIKSVGSSSTPRGSASRARSSGHGGH